MNQLYMIDTNTVSYIVKGESPASRARLANLKSGEIACISAITEAELRYGLARTPNATALRSAVEGFLAKIQVLVWGRQEAVAYGFLRAKQEAAERSLGKAGRSLGNLDLLIAAHAVSVGAILVTNDKAFSDVAFLHVSGLSATVNWASEF